MTDDFTADFCDNYPEKVTTLGPGFTNFGGAAMCQGTVVTIRLDRNNADLITLLKEPRESEPRESSGAGGANGAGKVVVVDAGGVYYAIVGEKLMGFAQANGYTGIIVNGYIRDTAQIKDIPVALYALGTCPRKYIPVTQGTRDIPVAFGGAVFTPGDYVYTDTDGVIVTPSPFL